jgi:hypothetical protein
MVVTPMRDGGEAAVPTRADPALVKALARAFWYQKLLDEGPYASVSELAKAERTERGYLGSLLHRTAPMQPCLLHRSHNLHHRCCSRAQPADTGLHGGGRHEWNDTMAGSSLPSGR